MPTRGNLGGEGDRLFDLTKELLEIIPTLYFEQTKKIIIPTIDYEEKRNKE